MPLTMVDYVVVVVSPGVTRACGWTEQADSGSGEQGSVSPADNRPSRGGSCQNGRGGTLTQG